MISDLTKAAIFYKRKKFGIIQKKEFVHAKTCANAHNKNPFSVFFGKGALLYFTIKVFRLFFPRSRGWTAVRPLHLLYGTRKQGLWS